VDYDRSEMLLSRRNKLGVAARRVALSLLSCGPDWTGWGPSTPPLG
jgi:hypothetical protein